MVDLLDSRTLNFLLYDVFSAHELCSLKKYSELDRTIFDEVILTAKKIAENYFLPHNQKADDEEPTFDGERVRTIPEVKEAWAHFCASGLLSARFSHADGGMQLPAIIHGACCAFMTSANPSTSVYPFLTTAAANVITTFGGPDQKSAFLPGMLEGRFSGTMALTEPDVGSSLGDLSTSAILQKNGRYKIKGQKIFITGGDQDITENIIHLVLARIQGAPQGSKGLSLFIVPKFLVLENGDLGGRNDVQLTGLLHKMGYRGATSCVLQFGEEGHCEGLLLGEENKGLPHMFKMMNEARIAVGLGAASIGYRGYLASLDYAKNRPQGRSPSQKNLDSPQIAIIEHADVKRMLLAQKSYVEGSLALVLFSCRLVDEIEAGQNLESELLLDLITPVVKSFPSTYGALANDLAIQVLGGSGYIREYPVEQCYRDNRLNPIHEGTHGIQALDLLGRKMWQHEGKGQKILLQRMEKTLAKASQKKELAPLAQSFCQYLQIFGETTAALGRAFSSGQLEAGLANASLYLDMMGKIIVAWIWLDISHKAVDCYADSASLEEQHFLAGKIQATRYFINWELSQIKHHAEILKNLDSTCSQMKAEWF